MKKIFSLILLLLMPIAASAYDAVVDGIAYHLEAATKEAEVTRGDTSYRIDSLVVPSSIVWDGIQYRVTRIGEQAFFNDSTLSTVVLPESVTDIRAWAFGYCNRLTSVSLGLNVRTIGEEAFVMCRNLTDISLPNSVNYIGDDAFCGCCRLKAINIPSNMTEIRDGVFCGCERLTDIVIPNTIASIGDRSFSRCSRLHFVIIGNGVKRIKTRAFEECVALATVHYHAEEVPMTADDVFWCSTFGLASLYVPDALVESYKVSEPWSDFYDIRPLSEAGIVQVIAPQLTIEVEGGILRVRGAEDGETITVYDLDGHTLGQSISRNGSTSIDTHQPDGSIVIVKMRDWALKVVMRD